MVPRDESWWLGRLKGAKVCFVQFPPTPDCQHIRVQRGQGLWPALVRTSTLRMLCEELSILPFLLFGHPSMRPKQIQQWPGGIPLLLWPEFISAGYNLPLEKLLDDLVDTINFSRLPQGIGLKSEMFRLATELGGGQTIDFLQQSLRDRLEDNKNAEDEASMEREIKQERKVCQEDVYFAMR